MASTTALPADIRARLETTRRVLGLSQGDLSTMAGISQGNVSNCLQGRNVRTDSLRRLLSAFASAVASADDHGVSPEQAKELHHAIDAARRAVDGNVEGQLHFARPGAPLPESAANRIERLEDQKLLRALEDAPFTAAVMGPPECGRTTLLQLLVSEAQRRGFAVVDFDARILEVEDIEDDSTSKFFHELAYDVATLLGVEPPKVEGRLGFLRFLLTTRLQRPAPPLLIVVDHTSEVHLALEDLAEVCRILDAKKGRTQMSWVIEASALDSRKRIGVLSRLAPSPVVELEWFSREQYEDFARLYELKKPSQVEDLWNWFEGQPFLTHAALSRFRELRSAGESEYSKLPADPWTVLACEIKDAEKEFARHLSRLRDSLDRHLRSVYDVYKWDLDEFISECKEHNDLYELAIQHRILKQRSDGDIDSTRDMLPIYRSHLFKP